MNKFPFLLFLLALAFQATAQKDSLSKYSLEQLFVKAERATENMDPSIKIYSEEILSRNPHDTIKAIALYDIGDLYYACIHNDLDNAIKTIEQSIKYAQKSNYYHLLKKDLQLMAYFYIDLNQNEKALEYVAKLNKVHDPNESYVKSLLHPINSDRIYGMIGDFKREASGYRAIIRTIDSYISSHQNIPKETLIDLQDTKIHNCAWLAMNYNYQKKLDSAAYYIRHVKKLKSEGFYTSHGIWAEETFDLILRGRYDDAIKNINASQKYMVTNREIYLSLYYLAICSQQKKEYKKSLEYCEKAIAINIKKVQFINPQLELYNIASKNAEKLGDTRKSILYSKKYMEASQKINYAEKAAFIANLYKTEIISPLNEQLTEKKKTASLFTIISIAIGVLAIASITFAVLKAKRDKKNFLAVIAQLEQEAMRQKLAIEEDEEEEIKGIEKESGQNTEIKKSALIPMSDEASQKIEKQFSTFEKKQHFLYTDISLSSMASDFNTNAGYLTAAIKKHKGTNFNGYINDLRIDYIIHKLKNEPDYSNYKIAYLAEQCGFASHAVFNRAFVQKTGISPSKFIDFLKKQSDKKTA